MTDEHTEELISAAFDGESVDVEALRNALLTANGRDTCASLLLLRAAIAADTTEPSPRLVNATTGVVARTRAWLFGADIRVPAGLAACCTILLVIASFWIGTNWPSGRVSVAANQSVGEESRVPAVQADADLPPTSEQQVTGDGPPPAPTRVVRFTPGVDWHLGS